MKKLFLLIPFMIIALPVFSEAIGPLKIVTDVPEGYKREVIPFVIKIPGTTEKNDLDIRLDVLKGEGVVLTSNLSYSVIYDAVEETTETITTNQIGFVPLSEGEIELKAHVKDLNTPEIELESNILVLNLIPRPPQFKAHKPFLHLRLPKERYYVGEEILLSYELFFSEMVQHLGDFKPDFTGIPADFIKPLEERTIYFSKEATTVRTLSEAIITSDSSGI